MQVAPLAQGVFPAAPPAVLQSVPVPVPTMKFVVAVATAPAPDVTVSLTTCLPKAKLAAVSMHGLSSPAAPPIKNLTCGDTGRAVHSSLTTPAGSVFSHVHVNGGKARRMSAMNVISSPLDREIEWPHAGDVISTSKSIEPSTVVVTDMFPYGHSASRYIIR